MKRYRKVQNNDAAELSMHIFFLKPHFDMWKTFKAFLPKLGLQIIGLNLGKSKTFMKKCPENFKRILPTMYYFTMAEGIRPPTINNFLS